MASSPSPPIKGYETYQFRKPSKVVTRNSKISNSSHEYASVMIDQRRKRVWKACERCKMKKIKCDGASPCTRCKGGGVICMPGSRKKTEFKQLTRGYAEVLENTQYALIGTVHKLYAMVRNNEPWDLGEPEMNDRGQPVIHDVASKLGCIRPSPDLPNNFPEGAEDFAELQAQLQAAPSEATSKDTSRREHSEESTSSPALGHTDRASTSESEHSSSSKACNQTSAQRDAPHAIKPAPSNLPQTPSFNENYQPWASSNASYSAPSPRSTDLQTESFVFCNSSMFSPWSGPDDFLGPAAHALDLTAQYLRAQQMHRLPTSSVKATQLLTDDWHLAHGTIRPTMLDYNAGVDISDHSNNISSAGECDSQMA